MTLHNLDVLEDADNPFQLKLGLNWLRITREGRRVTCTKLPQSRLHTRFHRCLGNNMYHNLRSLLNHKSDGWWWQVSFCATRAAEVNSFMASSILWKNWAPPNASLGTEEEEKSLCSTTPSANTSSSTASSTIGYATPSTTSYTWLLCYAKHNNNNLQVSNNVT